MNNKVWVPTNTIHVHITMISSENQSLRPHLTFIIRGTPPQPPESECGTNLVAGPRSRSWWEAGTVLACSDPPCAAEPPPDPTSDNGDNCSHYLVHSVRHSNCRTELSFHSSTSLSPLKHECETSTQSFHRELYTQTNGICLVLYLSIVWYFMLHIAALKTKL